MKSEKSKRESGNEGSLCPVDEAMTALTVIKNWIFVDLNLKEKKNVNDLKPSSKRPATSPVIGSKQKRSAFGNITNAGVPGTNQGGKKTTGNIKPNHLQKEHSTRRQSVRLLSKRLCKPVQNVKLDEDKSLRVFEDHDSSISSSSSSLIEQQCKDPLNSSLPTYFYEHHASPSRRRLNYHDLDAENACNINESPEYAFTIFEYMKARECYFIIKPQYLSFSQKDLTADMRAILVDWMVEMQENFELNHETLYLAVKLVDHYLQEVEVSRERLQLVGATSLLIASKFDERHPPYVDDFLYICDDAYTKKDMLSMERNILTLIGFDINIPISYRFLRRYAKCMKSSMETLTLSRFVLELSLLSYSFVDRSASLMAAAALWLAIKMKKTAHEWSETLQYYTSRTERDVFGLACELNNMINESKQKKLKTVWAKYSHSIFFEVAKVPPLTEDIIEAEKHRIYSDTKVLLEL